MNNSESPGTDVIQLCRRAIAESALARLHAWGLREYGEVLAMQEGLREARRAGQIPDTWLAGEHPTVVTQGVRGAARDFRGAIPWPVFKIDRGGQTTIHAPGQLVIYPIVKTQAGITSQARMSRALLAATRDFVAVQTGIMLEIHKGRPGLFFEGRKAAAIGISIRGRVTMHGIAINLCNDLDPWRSIVPCGEPETKPVTLSELTGRRIAPQDLIPKIPAWLRETWGYHALTVEASPDRLFSN